MRAVQYHPKYCQEAADAYAKDKLMRWNFDSTHDLSVITDDGRRIKIGTFQSADMAMRVGRLIERHGLPELTS